MSRNILRNWNVWLDGVSFQGVATKVTEPEFNIKGEEFRAGGMDAPMELDMGMESLNMMVDLAGSHPEAMELVGRRVGGYVSIILRQAMQDENDNTVTPVVIKAYGKCFAYTPSESVVGELNTESFRFNVIRYTKTHGNKVIHNIDIPNMIRFVNGFDQNENIRDAIGI